MAFFIDKIFRENRSFPNDHAEKNIFIDLVSFR